MAATKFKAYSLTPIIRYFVDATADTWEDMVPGGPAFGEAGLAVRPCYRVRDGAQASRASRQEGGDGRISAANDSRG